MSRIPKSFWTPLCVPVTILVSVFLVAPGHSQQGNKTLVVMGHTGEATVIQRNGRPYVDLQMLAETVNGTLGYQGSRIVLTLPSPPGAAATRAPDRTPAALSGFSREFVNAAIETLGSMREWASTLALIMKNGYPVGNAMAEYRGRAVQSFALTSAAASTDSDRNGLQLLTNEFDDLQTWSNNLVQARNSMSAANFAVSPDALLNDPLSQKLLRCWQFLGPMFASGRFEDDGSCH